LNPWQVARQLKSLLEAAVWPDTPSERVFARVLVTANVTKAAAGELRWPFCTIRPLDAQADEEEPDLLLQNYEVLFGAQVAGDTFGERSILGGPRSAGQGSSRGRGVLELEEEVLEAVADLNETNGIRIRSRLRSAVEAVEDEDLGYVAFRTHRLEAWTSSRRSYRAPTRLVGVLGVGSVTLAWVLPPARYDRSAMVVRRAAGGTPPADPTSGTGVTVGALDTGVVDAAGSGTFSYAIFMGYDELGAGADRFSPAVTITVVIP